MTGRILLLNGPSSAGKTSLSGAVAALLPTPWHLFPVDEVHAMRSRPDLRGTAIANWEAVLRASRVGYHRAIAGLAQAGCDVLADHVDTTAASAEECAPQVVAMLDHPPSSRAFDRRRAVRG